MSIAAAKRFGLVVAAAVLLTTGCGDGLLFAKDTRLKIVSPRASATVSLPVHLRWTTKVPQGSPLQYAVFVDVLPVHPDQNLRSVAGPSCARISSCVDVALLNRHSVYLTSRPSLDLETLPILGPPQGEPDVHQVSIVLVDPEWRRVGESAWSVDFVLRKERAT